MISLNDGVARILLQRAQARSSWWQSSRSESHLGLGLQKQIWLKFFATACHSNSNQCFNMRDRPISTHKNRPYLLQMSNYAVYVNAKRRFWARASNQNGQQLVLCRFGHSQTPGSTCPCTPCLATPLVSDANADPWTKLVVWRGIHWGTRISDV